MGNYTGRPTRGGATQGRGLATSTDVPKIPAGAAQVGQSIRLSGHCKAVKHYCATLMQLRFTSFAVINIRRDFHLQDRAHAGRTMKTAPKGRH